jgi:uncharacterized protein (TIGR00369 family)
MSLEHVPFAKLLGIEIESMEPGHAVLSMQLREEHMRNHGIAHGGVVATLIDSSMAMAITPLLAENESTVTVDLTIHYLRPVKVGVARSTARVVRGGRRVITVSAELFSEDGKLAATAMSTYLRMT